MSYADTRRSPLSSAVLALALIAAGVSGARAADAADKVSFKKDIQPILKASCVKCHGFNPKKPRFKGAAELRLDDEKLAMKGGRSGKAIIPGDAKDSLLFKLLHGPVPRPAGADEDDDKDIKAMPLPPKRGEKWKPLDQDKIDLIGRWIDQGANWAN